MARACAEYAFSKLGAKELYCLIKEDNAPSLKLAKKLGMRVVGKNIKHYKGQELAHFVLKADEKELYCLIKEDNAPSLKLAKKLGMRVVGKNIKHYKGQELAHFVLKADELVLCTKGENFNQKCEARVEFVLKADELVLCTKGENFNQKCEARVESNMERFAKDSKPTQEKSQEKGLKSNAEGFAMRNRGFQGGGEGSLLNGEIC